MNTKTALVVAVAVFATLGALVAVSSASLPAVAQTDDSNNQGNDNAGNNNQGNDDSQ
jgi:hypothetical protein